MISLISVRSRGRQIHKCDRDIFLAESLGKHHAACPDAIGFVNYQHAVYAVRLDAAGVRYIELTDEPLPGYRLARY